MGSIERSDQKPRYEHDCEACIFLGHYTHMYDFDLYVCPRETLGVCCIARWSSKGPDYSSMSLESKMWNESRAAIGGPRQSMYHCYIPELCEAWARWKARQDTVVFHPNPDVAEEAMMAAEKNRKMVQVSTTTYYSLVQLAERAGGVAVGDYVDGIVSVLMSAGVVQAPPPKMVAVARVAARKKGGHQRLTERSSTPPDKPKKPELRDLAVSAGVAKCNDLGLFQKDHEELYVLLEPTFPGIREWDSATVVSHTKSPEVPEAEEVAKPVEEPAEEKEKLDPDSPATVKYVRALVFSNRDMLKKKIEELRLEIDARLDMLSVQVESLALALEERE